MSTLVDVIVPVWRRTNQAHDFMRSLGDEDRARVWVVGELDDKDTRQSWTRFDCNVIAHPTAHTFAEKVNAGYRMTTAPWLLLVGDDCRFTPSWLDHAIEVASTTRAAVVGTNDGTNPRVMRGSHSCHPFIRRSYVDHVGASWDGPGVVCHEGYRHNYVDDEIVTAAKQRGVWAFAEKCLVRHLHPVWGTAPVDGTYRHGGESADADRVLFRARKAAHAS